MRPAVGLPKIPSIPGGRWNPLIELPEARWRGLYGAIDAVTSHVGDLGRTEEAWWLGRLRSFSRLNRQRCFPESHSFVAVGRGRHVPLVAHRLWSRLCAAAKANSAV